MVLCMCSDQDIMCYSPQSKTEWLPALLQANVAYSHKILRADRWTFGRFWHLRKPYVMQETQMTV